MIWIPLYKRYRSPIYLVLGICDATLAGTLLWTVVFALFNPLADKLEIKLAVRTVVLLACSLI